MRKPDFQKIIEWLAFVLRCPICGNKYNTERTNIVDSRETERTGNTAMLVHTDCEKCKSSVVFSISMEGPDIFSVGMVTDLTSQDTKKFREAKAVTADDVLAFHDFLRNFDGDFEKALG
ncbi:hypothetical protein D4R52_03310 [bacterium]|nr:MAG: hypothetical protein D4R52_03310 [bacterium]